MVTTRTFLFVLLLLAGCGGTSSPTSPTPPSPATPAGTWSGTLRDPLSGDGSMRLTLDANTLGSFSGTWSVTFRNGESFTGPAATAEVPPTSYAVTLYVDPQPSCSPGGGDRTLLGFQLINTVITSTRMTAVAGRLSCSGPSFGSIELSKS